MLGVKPPDAAAADPASFTLSAGQLVYQNIGSQISEVGLMRVGECTHFFFPGDLCPVHVRRSSLPCCGFHRFFERQSIKIRYETV